MVASIAVLPVNGEPGGGVPRLAPGTAGSFFQRKYRPFQNTAPIRDLPQERPMQFSRQAAQPWRPVLVVLAMTLLAACAGKPTEMPAAAVAQAPAAEADAPPMEMHEASAQCWMQVDKTRASIDVRSKLVDKCIEEKMKKAGR
jgi:hypothetical protein